MSELVLEPGTVIRNRNRLWRIDARYGDEVIATSIDGGDSEQHRFYVPFEEIEPGKMDLPDANRVGHPQSHELLLRAYRLSMLHGTAPLLSLQRSSVVPTDYQLVPVIMALDMPRVRLLIADDVGLGKTIESGLIRTELVSRQLARNALIICPASLREQWREQLERYFHADARIISSRHRRQMERELPPGSDPWEYYPYLITSIDYAKEASVKHQILEHHWDLVLIDEAHYVAKPHQSTPDQNVEMDRWELGEALAKSERVRHLIMLTATPHNGFTDSYASLLSLLDVGAVTGSAHSPQINRRIACKHVCQRRRKDIEHWFQEAGAEKTPFPERDQQERIIELSKEAQDAINSVKDYGKKVIDSAQGTTKRHIAQWTILHLHKRTLSSPEALRCSIRNRMEGLQNRLRLLMKEEHEDVGVSVSVAKANVLDFDTGERLDDNEAGRRVERQVYGTADGIAQELDQLAQVFEAAKKVTPAKDSKLQCLLKEVLPARLWIHPRVIIFTKYTDTLRYLQNHISRASEFRDVAVITMDGSLNEGQRRERLREFERADSAVLIATDCISEGVDLQYACAQIIHYELPWNPNRLEQRNGRVDRYGQPVQKVHIWTLVMNEQLDLAILHLLIRKAAQIREAYGWCPPYFGDENEILRLLERRGFSTYVDKGLQGTLDFGDNDDEVQLYSEEALKRVEGDSFFGQVSVELPEVQSRLKRTYDMVASPKQVQEFVLSGLDRFECDAKPNNDGTFRISIRNPQLQIANIGNTIPRATFDPEQALGDPDITVLEVGHPLVRKLIEVVKHAAWQDEPYYGRTAYRVTPDVSETTALLHVLARYQAQTEPVGIMEEMVTVASLVYGTGLLPEDKIDDLLSAHSTDAVRMDSEVRETLGDLLSRNDLENIVLGAAEARMCQVAEERKEWRIRLESEDSTTCSWLHGADQLSIASVDLLTVTILYPA